ncbi:RNase H-like domain found in reverse transcriptase [Popillia japonica]|uniref:RNase H-like domain found in reverse transcriptase n=1 Tax=Popillia japonica TaxID=7064 RepID=A0AAW1I755_POPJA
MAFSRLKTILVERPVLAIYHPEAEAELRTYACKYGYGADHPEAEAELRTYACKYGYGAALMQESGDGKMYPIYYMSKKTSPAEKNYCSYELEILAIVTALKNFSLSARNTIQNYNRLCSVYANAKEKKVIHQSGEMGLTFGTIQLHNRASPWNCA